ncbi:SprT family protein [Alkalibacillus salilacus]|uniref:SprT-like protein n=1 Tax=Alkalibacillus salilacus TaxID=284582 RepID=A0ABT9VE51_9BACI|nr:SprT family protein [Alkalibacillus salilacus]MDQ0159211.1 SprT-like protein [Alkalibacillus salilacus]
MDEHRLQQLAVDLSKRYFQKPFKDHIIFNRRLRTTGGRYVPKTRTIEINPKYLEELGEDALIGIIKHELCHYHLHIEGKPFHHRSHEFRELMKQTDSPRFCEQLPSEVSKRRLEYKCTNCSLIFKRKRRVNTQQYRCGKCGGRIKQLASGD